MEKRKTYNFAQIQRKISILAPIIILYRLNKIILMRREKNFPCGFSFFFFTNWVYDPGLIEFKTHSLRMPES